MDLNMLPCKWILLRMWNHLVGPVDSLATPMVDLDLVMAMEMCMTVMGIPSLKRILSLPNPCISIISHILTLGLFRNTGLISNPPPPRHPFLLHPLILDWPVQVQTHIQLRHHEHQQHNLRPLQLLPRSPVKSLLVRRNRPSRLRLAWENSFTDLRRLGLVRMR